MVSWGAVVGYFLRLVLTVLPYIYTMVKFVRHSVSENRIWLTADYIDG